MKKLFTLSLIIFLNGCATDQSTYAPCPKPQWESLGYKNVTNNISACFANESIELDGLSYKCNSYVPNITNEVQLFSKKWLAYDSNNVNQCLDARLRYFVEPECSQSNTNPNFLNKNERYLLIEYQWHTERLSINNISDGNLYSVSFNPYINPDLYSNYMGCLWEGVKTKEKIYIKLPH